ncbi:innexin domain-containing protein [Ditylenchus destructor]|nr:innexin domain-containing protein [Ditylenchus destructor]
MLGIPFLDDAITKWFKPQTFDDPVDRLNYFVTSTMLTFFAIMVSAKQYVGSPIQCWMPMEFKGGWEQYAEDYCFIQNTYYVSPEEEIPTEVTDRDQRQFGYYQWVPIVLALQAVMFYLPFWIWKTLHQQSGIDLSTAIHDARNLRNMTSQERKNEIKKLVTYVSECLEISESRRAPRRVLCFRIGSSLGSYVSTLYLCIKLLYLANVFGQFVLLNSFIGRGYNMWGWTALTSLWSGTDWLDSPVFPRVSLCDFRVRRLANMHRYTVQCVLMINMFNEKIYLFIWFWFLFVAISTIINFFYCVITMVPPSARERTIRQFLKQGEILDTLEDRQLMVKRFSDLALRPDGVLLLRFIEGHAGAIVARDLCQQLFAEYVPGQLIRYHMGGGLTGGNGGSEKIPHHMLRAPGSHTTKSTSPDPEGPYGFGDGDHNGNGHEKLLTGGLSEPDAGHFLHKPKHV